jgi:signal transduction histidine kinase
MKKTFAEIFSLGRIYHLLGRVKWPIKTIAKTGIIATGIFAITLLHYLTAPEAGIRHVVFRELYFLPIILGGFWYGLRGGLVTALSISILYSPLILTEADIFSTHNFGNIMEILLFNLVAVILGWLRDREKILQRKTSEAENLAAVGQAAAMIAHEFKTPLVTIGGLARRLTYNISPETNEWAKANVIRHQSQRLEKLVSDILFFARPARLSLQEYNLCQLLQRANEAVLELSQNKGVGLVLPAEEKCTCMVDAEKMILVFINLLTNAIEASSAGEPVTISLAYQAGTLQVDVADRGPGIPENIIDKIFEPFVSGKQKGTGLGLPISRKIVEAHSGRMECRNNFDAGATFSIIIPKTGICGLKTKVNL